VAIVAVIVTNFPLPQLTNGPLLRSLVHSEAAQGLPVIDASGLTFGLPDEGFSAVAKRFSVPFGAVGSIAFVIATLTVMAGVASSPWLLPRVTMTPGVYETRKSLGWATVFFAFLMLTAAAVAVYMRDYVMDSIQGASSGTLPDWMRQLVDFGFVQIDRAADALHYTSFKFARDKVLLSLPIAAGLPPVFVYFTAAGVIAACLVAAASATVALGNIIAEDVISGASAEPLARDLRLNVGRVSIAAVGVLGGAIALLAPTDPLRLLLWSLALTGSTLFPVIVLSIWWKRMNAFGALAGLACGFAVAVLTILAGEASILGLNGALAGILGIPAGTLGAMLASNATPGPTRSVLELVREIRIPGGEVVYDREMRLLRLKNRERA
jgi:cation/acetate symporter